MLPNFFIIGAPKCGTSSLHNWLEAHPEVTGSFRKETFFFSERELWGKPPSPHVSDGIDRYPECFPDGEATTVVFESTASYIYSPTARDQIPKIHTHPKVLAIVREPTSQIFSTFRYFQNTWSDIPKNLGLAAYVAALRAGNTVGRHGLVQHALKHASYIDYLLNWRDVMGDALKVIVFENMKRDPRSATKSIARWLEIDDGFFDAHTFDVANESYAVRNPTLQSINRRVRDLLPSGTIKIAAKKLYRTINTAPSGPPEEADRSALNDLRATYKESNRRLAREFDLDLGLWET